MTVLSEDFQLVAMEQPQIVTKTSKGPFDYVSKTGFHLPNIKFNIYNIFGDRGLWRRVSQKNKKVAYDYSFGLRKSSHEIV